jgi:hypothetical protein
MENEFDDKIKVFEQEYFFDTEQERKLALRDFAKEISKEKDAEIKKLKEKIKELREDCLAGEGLVVEQIALNKKLKEEIERLKAGEIENHNDTKYMSIKDNGKEHKVGE